MQTITPSLLRTTGLVASVVLALSTAQAAETAKPQAADKDALPTFNNYLTIGGLANWASGDKAAFEARSWTARKGFGGIQDFQYSRDVAKDVSLNADGHFLMGNADYLAHVNVAKTDIGSVDVGYKRFRTYYDNAGGFTLPTTGAWAGITPYVEALHVDRSKFWAEAKLALPNAPVLTLRYTNELRNGAKDTTIWGVSDYTGLSGLGNSTSFASRFITPGYIQLGERQQTLDFSVKHTVGNTTVDLDVQGNRVNNLNTRFFDRYPGQVKFPAPATTGWILPGNIQNLNNEVRGYDQVSNLADTFTASVKAETVVSKNIKAHAGIRYQLLNSDFMEDRPVYTATTFGSPLAGYVWAPSAQAQNLAGEAKIKAYTANIGADIKVGHDLAIGTELKAEDRYNSASELYQTRGNPTVTAAGLVTLANPAYVRAGSRSKEDALTPEVSLRYTGIKNISLYGKAEYRYVAGDERVTGQYNPLTAGPSSNSTYKDVHENHGRYTVGANWVPCTYFNLRGETFYKDNQNNFQTYWDSTGSPSFVLGYKLKGVKISATVKPLPTISATTRYIYQAGQMQTAGYVNNSNVFVPAESYQSMDSKSHNIGETIDWTPVKQFYMQGSINVVFDTTSTSYPRAGTSAVAFGNDAVHNSNNNYVNGSLLAGMAVDKDTNAEIQYSYYKANNYEAALITSGLPYGAGRKDYTLTVGLKRKMSDTVVLEGKLGYMDSKCDTTGGRTNFSGYVASVSLTQGF